MSTHPQCLDCINYSLSEECCRLYEDLPGEGERSEVSICSSRMPREDKDNLALLIKYLDHDEGGPLEQVVKDAVDKTLSGYSERMKVTVVGIARRKIKSIIKMSDVIDNLLDRLDSESLDNLSASQSIRLLSELNNSVNNDLSFIMKLLQPDSTLKDVQAYFDNRSVTYIDQSGSSEKTSKVSSTVLETLSGTSRENVRKAFDMILETMRTDDEENSDPLIIDEEETYDENL